MAAQDQKIKDACRARHWTYCAEHDRPMWNGPNPCVDLHTARMPHHAHWCDYPFRDCVCPADQGKATVGQTSYQEYHDAVLDHR